MRIGIRIELKKTIRICIDTQAYTQISEDPKICDKSRHIITHTYTVHCILYIPEPQYEYAIQ